MRGRLVEGLETLVATTPFVTIDGASGGSYRVAGTGSSLLVVLPGVVGAGDALAELSAALANSRRVCFVTYPRARSLADLLRWLEDLRQREGGGAAALYGGSFGGLVAQAWLAQAPDSVGDVVLSGTGPPDPARAVKNARALPWMRRLPMPAWRALLRLAVRGATRRAADRESWRAYYGRAIEAFSWDDIESRYRVSIDLDAAGPPRRDALDRWRGRMLVLEGSRDRIARSSARAKLRDVYPRAEFHVFEGAGHGLALEQPDEWLRVVTSFFRRDA
jgi:pimeloyl-ACP methyl ester carboxylesterase